MPLILGETCEAFDQNSHWEIKDMQEAEGVIDSAERQLMTLPLSRDV